MWFKNLQVYRLTAPWAMTPDELEERLTPQAFQPCTSLEPQSQGWLSPRENGRLVHTVNKQMLILLGTEKKLLPATVVNQMTKARAGELEEQQGFAPGRKQMRELKERVSDELLPRAFSTQHSTWTWIDPINGWLVVDAATPGKANDVFKLLLKAVDRLPVESLRVVRSPQSCMTNWLATDEAPAGFTVDQDTELRTTGASKATVKYVRHTLEPNDMRHHIETGKQCMRLAMTWDSRISFVLTESLAIKRVAPLDVIKEGEETSIKNDGERFDSDFVLMTGELNRLLTALVETLGGIGDNHTDATQPLAQGSASISAEASEDQLYESAVTIVREQQCASISLIQRHLRIGYNRAARLLEEMEKNGVVSHMKDGGSRQVLKAA